METKQEMAEKGVNMSLQTLANPKLTSANDNIHLIEASLQTGTIFIICTWK